MASYTARVELHNASYADYLTLHAAMATRGFSRTIAGSDGKLYNLPTGTYDAANAAVTIEAARAAAAAAATQTNKTFEVIVVERQSAAWQGLGRN